MDNPEKESSSTNDDDVVEDEEREEESATDDEDYIEEHDETSNVSSEIKEKVTYIMREKLLPLMSESLMLLEAHASISHSRVPRAHKNLLKETYFGIPETFIKFFLKCCPLVSVVRF